MRLRKIGIAAAGLTMSLAVLGGCSSKMTADDMKKQLTSGSNALPQDLANCVVDGMVAKNLNLDDYKGDTLPADKEAIVKGIAADCALKGSGVSVPSIPKS